MSDHLSTQLLERYRERRLEPAELITLDGHLATCAACRSMVREMKPRRGALLSLQASLRARNQAAPGHLPQGQLMAYAEGRLDEVDRELAESHLEFCTHCAGQAQELLDSAQQQTGAAEPRFSPPTMWKRLVACLGLSSLQGRLLPIPLTLRVVGVVAVMALLIITVALWLRTGTDKQEIVVQPSPPSPSPPKPSISPPPSKQPETSAPILLALNDGGGQITLDAEGNVSGVESLSPADQQRVKTALTTQKVQTSKALLDLSDSTGTIMGGATGTAFGLLGPVGKIVATDRPTFRWRPLGKAISYKVTITDPEAGYREVAASPELRDTNWAVDRPLERGRIYIWQVTARTDGGEVRAPAPNREAKFKVLEQSHADELARAEKAYAGRPLTLGLLYAQAGLLDEAEREFQALVATNPQSPVAKNLLRNVRAKRRTR